MRAHVAAAGNQQQEHRGLGYGLQKIGSQHLKMIDESNPATKEPGKN